MCSLPKLKLSNKLAQGMFLLPTSSLSQSELFSSTGSTLTDDDSSWQRLPVSSVLQCSQTFKLQIGFIVLLIIITYLLETFGVFSERICRFPLHLDSLDVAFSRKNHNLNV
jgi:hypothetical protein